MLSKQWRAAGRSSRKLRALVTLCVCVLVGVAWNLSQHGWQIQILSRFGYQHVASEPFWNKEQQRLNVFYNSIANLSGRSAPGPPLDPCEPNHGVVTRLPDYNTLPQRFKDFLLHMCCRSYPVRIDPPGMCQPDLFLLIAVKSLVPHFERRQAIRETWGRVGVLARRSVATVFLLGNTSSEDHFPDLQEMLRWEADLHGDILQWEFRDTFFNLTLKDVLFLDWFSRRCPSARFVLKADDDVFVNTLRIIGFLNVLSTAQTKDLFIGDVISGAGPHRDRNLKYFVPQSVYKGCYPPYAGGGGYLLSGDLAQRLHDVSRRVVFYPIDDVYTGMCLEKLGVVPQKHLGFRTFDIKEKLRWNPCIYRSLMLVHRRTPEEILKIWSWIIRPERDCQ